MTAESFGRPIHLTRLPYGGVAISIDTDYGLVPILAFPTWESFAEFASAVQDFTMKPDVPDIYKQAFNDRESSWGGDISGSTLLRARMAK
ncbi:hypothetical protein ES703_110403 [subsurface metagenome]